MKVEDTEEQEESISEEQDDTLVEEQEEILEEKEEVIEEVFQYDESLDVENAEKPICFGEHEDDEVECKACPFKDKCIEELNEG